MAVKKSELYSTLWKCCDELRGGMDASQYKDYVLVILFVKYISDKSRSDAAFDIEIPDGCYFEDFVALKGNPNIGEEINKKMQKLAEANQLDGVFVADFDDEAKLGKGKDKVETLSKLIAVFQNENLDFSKNRAADDDLIGDAYEYLMKNFATESGKSKGQFYTPAEVSRVMAKVIGLSNAKNGKRTTIYDPTCGSGSLLLRAMCETPEGATVYGQEKDNATVGLAKMNMILHNEIYADIKQGDTINDPQFKDDDQLKTFDYIVANPPFSTKSWLKSAKAEDEYHRWGEGIKIGVPPEKNGDYAFLLHIVRSLKQTGCAACILPHGVLFRGNAEAQIRKYIVAEKRYIKGIIGLPANLFFGTGIPACIIIIEKSEAAGRKGVFMIDAKGGYIKDGAKNRLREQDIRRIVDVWQSMFLTSLALCLWRRLSATTTISISLAMSLLPTPRYCKISKHTSMEVCPSTISTNWRPIGTYAHCCVATSSRNILRAKDTIRSTVNKMLSVTLFQPMPISKSRARCLSEVSPIGATSIVANSTHLFRALLPKR